MSEKLVQLSPKDLVPHPDNPRGKLEEKDVEDLRPIIEAQGQQQPCVVRPHPDSKGKYQVIIGHRRAAVARLLKRDVPSLVVDLNDEQALAVMLADNPSHAAPDPLRESEAVAIFLKRPGMTLQGVADLLGKSPRWVAQRANLQNLAPGARKESASETGLLSKWPVAWLERLASLATAEQEQLVDRFEENEWERPATLKDLEGLLAEYTNKLAAAPWDLQDALLLPEAGSCADCPKQTSRSPGLFDDGQACDLKKALCRDASCWKAKLAAHAAAKVKELKQEHPNLVRIEGKNAWNDPREEHIRLQGIKKLRSEEYSAAKKGDKGAVPALVTAGDDKGKVRWVKPKKGALDPKPRPKRDAKEEPKETPEAKKKREAAERVQRRHAVACKLASKEVAKLPRPGGATGDAAVLALAAAFGCRSIFGWKDKGRPEFLAAAAAGKKDHDDLLDELWTCVQEEISGNDSNVFNEWRPESPEVIDLVAKLLNFDMEPFRAEALKKIPEPKEVGELPPAKGKKGKAAKKAKASAVKKCRQCGCTEDKACPEGCAWYVRETDGVETDLCTACAEKNQDAADQVDGEADDLPPDGGAE